MKLTIEDTYLVDQGRKMHDLYKVQLYLTQKGKEIYGPDFFISPAQNNVIISLFVYAKNVEEELQKRGIDPQKGLLLMGKSGCGKTSIFHLLKPFFNSKMKYDIKSCKIIAQDFSYKGYEALQPFWSENARVTVLDNLGAEPQGRHYGNLCDVVPTLIERYYENRTEQKIPKLHITTQLNPAELEKKYGIGFRRMLKEMFNVIVF
ncbi:MAG: hypothetical protein LBE34_02170 [Flavobacteriaceae bacterium]|jgi:DNA replication protein DnaC|nr:hypothetical protein [Flavobacteriaceae bacterium]